MLKDPQNTSIHYARRLKKVIAKDKPDLIGCNAFHLAFSGRNLIAILSLCRAYRDVSRHHRYEKSLRQHLDDIGAEGFAAGDRKINEFLSKGLEVDGS